MGIQRPDFLVLGAPKCGTTSLYYYLAQHPSVYLCRKEIHYFIRDDPGRSDIAIRNWEDYVGLFGSASEVQRAGEVAVRYLYSANALNEIKARIPRCRLIVMLRNPVDRAFSNYLMRYRTGGGSKRGGRIIPSVDDIRIEFDNLKQPYIQWGEYGRYLEPWYEAFGTDQLAVYTLEELGANPAEVMQSVFAFLGVDAHMPIDGSEKYNVSSLRDYNPVLVGLKRISWLRTLRSNRHLRRIVSSVIPRHVLDRIQWRKAADSGHVTERVRLPDDVRERLAMHYQSDVARLEELTGRSFSGWFGDSSEPTLKLGAEM